MSDNNPFRQHLTPTFRCHRPLPGIDLTTDSTNETSIIYYYQNDAATLSLPDLCDSSGTYAPVN